MFYGDPLSVELSKMNISLKSALTKLTNDYYKMVKILNNHFCTKFIQQINFQIKV